MAVKVAFIYESATGTAYRLAQAVEETGRDRTRGGAIPGQACGGIGGPVHRGAE